MRATALLTGFILAVGALTMTTGAQTPADNTLTAAEQKAGWRLLFDGKTMDQWRNYKGTEVGTNWTIVDGAITLTTPRRAVDIISKDEFGDFDFALLMSPEKRMPPSAITGMPCAAAAREHSITAVIIGTPMPAITRVVQIEPAPMPTFTASTPRSIRASVASAVATFPAMRSMVG